MPSGVYTFEGNPEVKDLRWWAETKDKWHERVQSCCDLIEKSDSDRATNNDIYTRLYGNRIITDSNNSVNAAASPDRVTLNIIKATSDTVASKIAKNKPRPVFLTSGGNYSLKRKARLLEKWVDTQFYTCKVYRTSPRVFKDAEVYGTGIWKVYREGEKICVERVHPSELLVDAQDGMYGEPRQLFQQKAISRELLLGMYPQYRKKILEASQDKDDAASSSKTMADKVLVTEAWHLPTNLESDNGHHCICIENCTLEAEPYTKDHFPFVFLNWSDPLEGFWGKGLAEELIGIQVEINRLLIKIQKSFHLASMPRIFAEAGSKVTKAHFNNDFGNILTYIGTMPVQVVAPSVNPEIFSHLDRLYQRAFDIAGVSQDSVGGMKPAGLESGKAIREYRDLGTERFSVLSTAYEYCHMTIAEYMVELGKEIADENPKWRTVASRDKYTIQEVPWKDMDLKKDTYVLKVFPSSALPASPAGRLAFVDDLMAAGLITADRAKVLLDFPDLESEMAVDRATEDTIDKAIETMLDSGEFVSPEPFIDPNLALRKVQAAYLRSGDDNVPEERRALLREYMVMTNDMIQKAAMAAQPQQAAPPPQASPDGAQEPPIQG